MTYTRRQFVSSTSGACALYSFSTIVPEFLVQASAAEPKSSNENILVVVQLSGGNDALNTVIPYDDDVYRRNRVTLSFDKNAVLKIDDSLGFHPALTGFDDLYQDGKLSIIQGVGYPNPNRSHFESMDIWHSALRKAKQRPTGWIGRTLDVTMKKKITGQVPALHLGAEVLPLALVAEKTSVPSLQSLKEFQLQDGGNHKLRKTIQRCASSDRKNANDLTKFVQSNLITSLAASRRIQQSIKTSKTGVKYPSSTLAGKLQSVARLIDANIGSRIYYVTLNGFDTHSDQADAHAALLKELGDATLKFIEDLTKRGHEKRVTVMAFSEFGRRVKENASRGTDHGAAAPMFLAGGAIKNGLIGKHPSLTDLDDGDMKYHTDFRQVYATVLKHWLDVNPESILPSRFKTLKLFG